MSGNRFIFRDGTLHPLHVKGISTLLSNKILRKAVPSILVEGLKGRNTNKEDETIEEFMERRFGKYIAENFVAPLVIGIFGGNYKKLSMKSCFSSIYQLENKYGSIVRGSFLSSLASIFSSKSKEPTNSNLDFKRNRIFSFSKGLSELSNAIYSDLQKEASKVQVLTASPVLEISKSEKDPNKLLVRLPKSSISADYVISAIPSYELSKVVASDDKEIEQVKQELESIEFGSLAVINFLFTNNSWLKHESKGFGYLIPPSQKQPILGVTFDSITFPQQLSSKEGLIMTVMMGGDLSLHDKVIDISDVNKYSDQKLIEIALQTVESHLQVELKKEFKPLEIRVTRCIKAIPQFQVGHSQKVERIRSRISSIFGDKLLLAGNSYQYVSVNDVIHNSKELVLSIPLQ